MNKEQLIKLKKELEGENISLAKFLMNYCGIYNKKIYALKISHQDIKKLIPGLKRVSFDYLQNNIHELFNGNVIAVKDSFGNIVPYVNPKLDIEKMREITCKECIEENLPEKEVNECLSTYELTEICRAFRKNKGTEYRQASQLLKNRKCKVKSYKKKKDKLMMEGKDSND